MLGLKTSQGRITAVRKNKAGGMDVYATFLAAGPLQYYHPDMGEWTEQVLWKYITHTDSLVTATGKPVTLMHPDTPDALMDASQWRKYGMGMTSSKIYLDHPFATILCSIGDKTLVDKIEYGDVDTVSSARNSRMYRTDDGQLIQGEWEANHLAFIDRKTGHRGRCPHAHVHYGPPPQGLRTRKFDKPVKDITYITPVADSMPNYSFDLDNFVIDGTKTDSMIYLRKVDSTIVQKERIVLPVAPDVPLTKEDGNMTMTKPADKTSGATVTADAENSDKTKATKKTEETSEKEEEKEDMCDPKTDSSKAIADSVIQAIGPTLSKLADRVAALEASKADSTKTAPAPAITVEADALAAAIATGQRRGEVIARTVMADPKVDSVALAAMSEADLYVTAIHTVNPAVKVDNTVEPGVLYGVWQGVSAPRADAPAKTEYTGAPVSRADSDSKAEPLDTSVATIVSAYETQVAALKK